MHLTAPDNVDCGQVREVSRVTWVGVVVNVVLAVIKAAGGILAGSTVLLADAVHTVSDLATDCAILIGVRYWTAPADAEHPHGHRKIETMITVAIGLALGAVGLGLGYEAVQRLAAAFSSQVRPTTAVESTPAFWLALGAAALSIVSKELLYRWTARKGVALGSSALIANAWHHRSDAVSSIPPLLALGGEAVGREMGYNLWFLDPVGTVIVCVMLLQAAWEVAQPAVAALLDSSADRRLCSEIRKATLSTKGVIDAHRIRTRIICSNAVAVDLIITVDKNLSVDRGHRIATDVQKRILGLESSAAMKTRPVDVIVHVEPGDPRDMPAPSAGSDTLVDWMPKQ